MPIVDCRLPIVDCRLPIVDCRLPIVDCRLPIADCRLPIADCCAWRFTARWQYTRFRFVLRDEHDALLADALGRAA
ncbi:hypothetical protein [Candidatus Chloroploca sp. Khr17]|uniref:hypothetical protein n=1 Tax=Candidatus Chloroploca sp. Khr17 TaxID=2496869 RepID=UPI0013EC8013|nr:hypothetical protein [Candidatus Chloroploca sp. Khr17]